MVALSPRSPRVRSQTSGDDDTNRGEASGEASVGVPQPERLREKGETQETRGRGERATRTNAAETTHTHTHKMTRKYHKSRQNVKYTDRFEKKIAMHEVLKYTRTYTNAVAATHCLSAPFVRQNAPRCAENARAARRCRNTRCHASSKCGGP